MPAQCRVATSAGAQNACLYCHTNGVYERGLGNNPQAGLADNIGNLQTEYPPSRRRSGGPGVGELALSRRDL